MGMNMHAGLRETDDVTVDAGGVPQRDPGSPGCCRSWRWCAKAGFVAAKVALACFMLWWLGLFSVETLDRLRSAMGAPWLLAGSLLMALVSIHTGWIRWHLLQNTGGVFSSWRQSYLVNYASVFFGFFLPGNSGMDLIRMTYAWRGLPGTRSKSMGAVLADRVLGLLGLLFICCIAGLAAVLTGRMSGLILWLGGFAAILLAAGVAGLFLLPAWGLWLLARSGRFMPVRVRGAGQRMLETFLD